MTNPFSYLNTYYDKIYVLSLPRLKDRIDAISAQLKGLDFEFFFGVDRQNTSMDALKSAGLYSTEKYRQFYKRPAEMSLGMLCCALGHVSIYQSIIEHGYQRTLIFEDDAVPVHDKLSFFPVITEALPADWELLYLGYEKNEESGWKEILKRSWYSNFPYHAQLKLTGAMYKNYYPRRRSEHIAVAGFHDCTHAYAISLAGAEKLLNLQTPVGFHPDNLLAYAIATEQVKGYICRPKLFNQLSAFTDTIRSLTSH